MPVAWSDIGQFIDGETSPEVRDHLNEIVDDINAHVPDVDNPHETTIGNLLDTDAATPADNDILQYEADSALWVAKPLTAAGGLEKDGDSVAGHVVKWTAAGKLADAGYSPYDAGWNAYWIQGRAVADTAPSNGQVVLWSALNDRWEPGDLGSGTGAVDSVFGRTGAVTAATSDYDASQVDNDSAVTGTHVSDALNTLNSALSGKASTSHGATHTNGTDDVATLVGDTGSGGTKGLVPAPAAGDAAAGKYLGADGIWSVPAGGGSGGIEEVSHVGAPADSGYSVGDRIRDSLGAVFRCTSVSGSGAWCQETPGVVDPANHAFPTDADVRSGSFLGDTTSRAYRVRVESSSTDYQRWAIEWTLQRPVQGTDYLWVASTPQRLPFIPSGATDFTGASTDSYYLLHQPPTNAAAADLNIDGILLEGVVGYCSSISWDEVTEADYLRTAVYGVVAGSGAPTLLGVLNWNGSENLATRSFDAGSGGILLPFEAGSSKTRVYAAVEDVGSAPNVSTVIYGLTLSADVRWYHLETYGY